MSVSNLLIAEQRLISLNIHQPNSTEHIRYRDVVVPDLKSHLSDEDIIQYNKAKEPKSQEQIKKDYIRMIKDMETNQEKPSI